MLLDAIEESMRRTPVRRAVVQGKRTCSYVEFVSEIRFVAEWLGLVLPTRRAVGLCLPNSLDWLSHWLGALAAGHTPILMDLATTPADLLNAQRSLGIDCFLVERRRVAAIGMSEVAPSPAPETALVSLIPSGATAPPQLEADAGAVLRSESGELRLVSVAQQVVLESGRRWIVGTEMTGDERALCLLPLSEAVSLDACVTASLLSGGELHLAPLGSPLRTQLQLIVREKVTRLLAPVSFYEQLAREPVIDANSLSGLELACAPASARLEPALRRILYERLGIEISQVFSVPGRGLLGLEGRFYVPRFDGLPNRSDVGEAALAPTGANLVKSGGTG